MKKMIEHEIGGKILFAFMRFFGALIARPKIIAGKENLRIISDGNAVVIANHRHWFDPVVLLPLLPGAVRTMAKAELFRSRLISGVLRSAGAFPVRRGENDLGAFRQAAMILKKGQSLLIYPEGTRNKGETLLPFHSGAAALALRNRSVVLPVYTIPFIPVISRAKIIVGQPIDLDSAVPKEAGAGKRAQNANELLQSEMEKISRLPVIRKNDKIFHN